MSEDPRWMREALREARKAFGDCHPNPAVGALTMHRGKVVSRGYTQRPGLAHAEVAALAGWRAAGAPLDETTTLYVTLEPCCTHGRTPPCTDAILASGIRRVVVAGLDPNPAHAGRGFDLLRAGGIEVVEGVLSDEADDLNLVFNFWIQHNRPFIAAKTATTLDGFIATRRGHSQWITGEEAREDVARWRRAFPAIGVGAGTVLDDDPALTSRVAGEAVWCPRRIVFDRKGRCLDAPGRKVFSDEWAGRTVYVTSGAFPSQVPDAWRERGVEIWCAECVEDVLQHLRAAALSGLYLEGGAGLWREFLKAKAIDYLFAYQAPKILGDDGGKKAWSGLDPSRMDDAFHLGDVRRDTFGADALTRGYLRYAP